MSVTAVVINFNAGEALQNCVRSLLASTVHVRVMVADNASTDGSAANLHALYGSYPDVEILFNPNNRGFAKAVNDCARASRDDYLLITNPDCDLEPDALRLMVEALESDPGAVLAGPAVRDAGGRIEKASLRRFPDPWNALMTFSGLWRLGRWIPAFRGVPVPASDFPAAVAVAEAVSGSCMLVRRDALEAVGYMDEEYGLHCEDLDLMYRLREQGGHCLYVPQARAVHIKGLSSRSRPVWVHLQKHRGMWRFYRKFQAGGRAPPFNALVFAGIWLHFLLLLPFVWLSK